MFDFIFNPGVNNLIPETNRYSHTLRMRMQKNKVKYSDVLSLPKRVIALQNNPSYYDALQEAFKIFKEALHLCQVCSGYGFYEEVRNMYDYQFHLLDLDLDKFKVIMDESSARQFETGKREDYDLNIKK